MIYPGTLGRIAGSFLRYPPEQLAKLPQAAVFEEIFRDGINSLRRINSAGTDTLLWISDRDINLDNIEDLFDFSGIKSFLMQSTAVSAEE